ncbi:WD repeat-containing protein 18 [Araneus ventricosus]|uniref:WD repeat-containing protein 18 n=1 Tax=Araneus ventricosus TaxID=182803 RepID=A0A4Y2NKN0_ARAVE|nr:WD repeat-containing protein 18 [Araneus ventricosus]GBN39469.1 WD repeat-containing protein 18 [Araneus ventricosus]
MDDAMPEVIITSSNACTIYDANNANDIVSYKDGNTFLPKTLSLIGEDFLIGALSNKPMLKVWTISKQRRLEVGNFVVPGIVSALAVSNCGNYCIAGIKDQIFVWEVSTGDILMILCRHYQSVTCLKFTADDSRFFSGGKDGHVIVWILSSVISVSASHDNVKPQFVWTQHSAEVTDIYCGNTISRVATTSLDMTCKIYELDSGMLLASICMDVPLTSVIMDPAEYFIFLGDEQGYLYKINTYEKLPHEIHRADVNNKAALKLHETKIISLNISFDGRRLMTASEDQTCKLWDIQSMACVLNIRSEGALTNAFLARRPACLSNEPVLPQLFVRPFKKDTSLKNTGKKYVESRIARKELSLMYDCCPDKYYGHSLFCVNPGEVETMNATAVEDVFRESLDGASIADLTGVNQQIFTFLVKDKFNATYANPPSPS